MQNFTWKHFNLFPAQKFVPLVHFSFKNSFETGKLASNVSFQNIGKHKTDGFQAGHVICYKETKITLHRK